MANFTDRFIEAALSTEPERMLDDLLNSMPIHIAAFHNAAEDGRLGGIRIPTSTGFSHAKAWNEAAAGGRVTHAAEELAHSVLRGMLLAELEVITPGMGHDEVRKRLAKLMDAPEAGPQCALDRPVTGRPLPSVRRGEAPSRFFCEKRDAHSATRTYLTLAMKGWDNVTLLENLNGIRWLKVDAAIGLKLVPPLEQRSLAEYIGPGGKVIFEEGDLGEEHRALIADGAAALARGRTRIAGQPGIDSGSFSALGIVEISVKNRAGLRAFAISNDHVTGADLVVLRRGDLALIGGISNGMPFTSPEFRGQGYSSVYHDLNQQEGLGILTAGSYSRAGYQARCAAHREAVLLAEKEGRKIHPENRQRYLDNHFSHCGPD